jgi:hypothetical protein
MLAQWIRVFFSDNGVLTDYSIEAQQNSQLAFPAVATQDYIYVAQYFPFNNLFIEIDTANANASALSCEYWDGQQWRAGVDSVDATKSSGATLAVAGVFQFSPNKNYKWQIIKDTSETGNTPVQLQSLSIYDAYWMRLKVSADLSAGTKIRKISYAFTTNQIMLGIDPEINQYLTAWGGASKLDWNEQIILASQHLVADFKARQLIVGVGNIVRFDDIALAVAYRTLGLIYAQLGEAFKAKYDDSVIQYNKLLGIKRFTLDRNDDAQV